MQVTSGNADLTVEATAQSGTQTCLVAEECKVDTQAKMCISSARYNCKLQT